MNRGIWFGIGAYACWGLFPLYWKLLAHVPALQLLGHRIVWSCVILLGIVLISRRWQAFRKVAFAPRILRIYAIAAILVAANWLTYVWAVNAGYIVETSLGYFINPLFSVLMGVLFLRERLRVWQWGAIGLAATGVLYLTLAYGSLPWIALTLAFTFGTYGLVKKLAPLNSLYGLTLETSLLFLPALAFLGFSEIVGNSAFLHTSTVSDVLLIAGGLVTTVPLLLFASAARRIPLSMVGVLQYIAPTLQLLIGVLVFREPFSQNQLIGFGIVWTALIIFGLEGFLNYRMQPIPVVVE